MRFLSRQRASTLFLTDDALVMTLDGGTSGPSTVRVTFSGAVSPTRVSGIGGIVGTSNYFHGGDRSLWHAGVPAYARVRYSSLYPNIDLLVYSQDRRIEYDFVVAPPATPDAIELQVEGGGVSIEPAGDIRITSPAGIVSLTRPHVYQEDKGIRREVSGRYVMGRHGNICFSVGEYDRSRPLVIDPVLTYSSYLGGSDWDFLSDVRTDKAGNAYVCGYTASFNFPRTGQTAYRGGYDAFVAKIQPDGSLAYATYLGGSGFDNCDALAVDDSGFVYAAGGTTSADFPVVGGVQSALGGKDDAFITRIDPSGSEIVYSTYLGGAGSDGISAIAVDPAGAAYVAGVTNSPDFPLVNSVRTQYGGGFLDAFALKLNAAGNAIQFSTLMGGSGSDEPTAVAVNGAGEVFVGGFTMSPDFPVLSPIQSSFGGLGDGFLFKLSADGSRVLFSTYLGTAGWDAVDGLKALADGSVLVSGYAGFGFRTTSGALQPYFGGYAEDGFVSRLSGDGQTFLFSTYFGGNGDDVAVRVDVDPAGHVWIAGSTASTNLRMVNPVQGTYGGNVDGYVAELSANGSQLLFSTYLGGSDLDQATGMGVDGLGNVSVGGQTTSTDFPTVAAIQPSAPGGARDAFVSRIVANHAPTANAGLDQRATADATCSASVTLNGSGSIDPDGDALSYAWSGAFGTASTVRPTVTLPIGANLVTLGVNDGDGGTSSAAVQVTVLNGIPPSIDGLVATPSVLTPPDHRMVDVAVAAAVTPACGTTATCRIVSVSSNEPSNATGDGNTSGDWLITGPLTVQVRAERSGSGSGRVYTIVVECIDAGGNSARRTVTVSVP